MSAFGEAMKQRALRVRPTPAIEKHISKAFGHYLRIQILWILNERIASPSELAAELSAPLNRISGHIKVLKEAGCIELVERVVSGNTVQSFYRATARIFFDDTEWRRVPPTVQEGLRITLLQNLIDDAIEAMEREIYDSIDGSHMSWNPMLVDEQGRSELTELLERTLQEVLAIQERAASRLCAADREGFSYSVSIMGYPSIGGIKKVNPARKSGNPPRPSAVKQKDADEAKAPRKERASKPKRKRTAKRRPAS